jgi:hypothetical protein
MFQLFVCYEHIYSIYILDMLNNFFFFFFYKLEFLNFSLFLPLIYKI